MSIKYDDIANQFEMTFSHVAPDGKVTLIAVARLMKDPEYLKLPIVTINLEKPFADFLRKNFGIEQHRLDRISRENIASLGPLVFCIWPAKGFDGATTVHHVLVDGSHRYVKGVELGFTGGPACLVPEELWRRYEIVDLPPEFTSEGMREYITGGFSGIL